jgi:hypothetical protein
MGLVNKNNISRRRILKGGGNGEDGSSIFKLTTYKYLFSMLVLISYLLFVLSTILFVNACINFHKVTIKYDSRSDYDKLIYIPIFDYLKPNNFIVLDKFLLNADSNLKPPSIIFWTIVAIVIGCILLLGIHYWSLSKNPELIEYNKYKDGNEISSAILKCLPYLFIFIIVILFNQLQLKNIGGLKEIQKSINDTVNENINKTAIKANNTKLDLQNIKKILQKYISSPSPLFKIEDFDNYKDKNDSDNGIKIDIGLIIDIYKANTTKKLEDTPYKETNGNPVNRQYYDKQFERIYMNHIDEYFNLLKYNKDNKIEDDYYTEFYLLGLIAYKEDDDIENPNNKYDPLRYKLKQVLKQITSNTSAYFITIIVLYVLMCVGILLYLIIFDITTKMAFISLLPAKLV